MRTHAHTRTHTRLAKTLGTQVVYVKLKQYLGFRVLGRIHDRMHKMHFHWKLLSVNGVLRSRANVELC
jgi:hypothetical protein